MIFNLIKVVLLFLLVSFTACNEEESSIKYDGKKLLETKCTSCHNLDIPPTLIPDELAPPMMAVAFHVSSFVKPTNESQRTLKAIEFVTDYIHYPSIEKSFCDKESLKQYGLMPSQKENVTTGEAKAIASYMFSYFTQKNLSKVQEEQAAYNALPTDEKLVLKYKCKNCHRLNVDITGPSFKNIAKKYKSEKLKIISSIENGSTKKWNAKSGAVMPAYKEINSLELEILADWILKSQNEGE